MDVMTIIEQLQEGMSNTISIFVWSLVLSVPLGLVIALIRVKKIPVINIIIKVYISVMRGTPLMLQLYVFAYGPFFMFGVNDFDRFTAIILAFVLNYAAYFAEIFRSGIESMPKGQYEAAEVLGYSKVQRFIRIILPQVIKRIFPSLTNETITLVKDTSLAFTVSYVEMFAKAKQIATSVTSLRPLFIAGVFYYIFNFIVATISDFIEKKMNYYS